MTNQYNKQITFAEDMTDERQQEVLTLAKDVFLSSHIADSRGETQYTTIAKKIRSKMDQRHGKGWCCIVGRNFGSYVTHQMKTYIHFSMFNVHVLLFKP
mmetsp:Transcript_10407/g.20500  ORF Transcript_10407/g.20500 Transcript_10407/m.20500 type:complete len:99 (+) Transcript_10407:188-484(+)